MSEDRVRVICSHYGRLPGSVAPDDIDEFEVSADEAGVFGSVTAWDRRHDNGVAPRRGDVLNFACARCRLAPPLSEKTVREALALTPSESDMDGTRVIDLVALDAVVNRMRMR